MRKLSYLFFILVLFTANLFLFVPKSPADELDSVNQQIKALNDQLNTSVHTTKLNQSQLNNLQSQITYIENKIPAIQQDIDQKKQDIVSQNQQLAKQQTILNHTIADLYIKSTYNSPILTFLSSNTASELSQVLMYQQAAADQDKAIITTIVLSLKDLANKQQSLETEQANLAALKVNLDAQTVRLNKLIADAKRQQAVLSAQIAQLSAQQQALIAAKQAALTSIAGVVMYTQTSSSTGPAVAQGNFPQTIRVCMQSQPDGSCLDANVRTMNLETDYLPALGEMPNSWQSLEAYKAQAVAARTYAIYKILRSTNRNFDVYASTADQSYTGTIKTGMWSQAVQATQGQILTNGNGNTIIAYYSANAGGHTLTPAEAWGSSSGFPPAVDDTGADGKPNDDLNARCLDATYRWEYHYNFGTSTSGGSSIQYNDTCPGGDITNSNVPLTESDMEDLVDATIYAQQNNGTVPPNTMTHDQIKAAIGGSAIGTVQSITANIVNNQNTTSVSVTGSNQTATLNGPLFAIVFDVRSPGHDLIPYQYQGEQYLKYDILTSGQAHGTQGNGWYVYSYGYGHRIGLDQDGAYGMASQGSGYTQILSHYYAGTSITPIGYNGSVK